MTYPILCINCIHHSETMRSVHQCNAPGVRGPVSLVTGEQADAFCSVLRVPGGTCGPDATRFEPKPESKVA